MNSKISVTACKSSNKLKSYKFKRVRLGYVPTITTDTWKVNLIRKQKPLLQNFETGSSCYSK